MTKITPFDAADYLDDEETIANEATQVVEQAFKWCDEELAKYDDEEDED